MISRSTVLTLFALALFFALLPLQLSLVSVVDFSILIIGYIAIYGIARYAKYSISDLGLSTEQFRKSFYPNVVISFLIVIGFISVYLFDSSIFLNDKFDKSLNQVLVYVFLLLPIQVILIEELYFRGLLLKSLQSSLSFFQSALISSLLFGVWHVFSSRNLELDNSVVSSNSNGQIPIIIATVIATGLAGYLLCCLRKKHDSLYIAIAIHWVINATGVILAFMAS